MERKRALMVIPVLAVWFAFLLSCVTIDAVTQPETGSLGNPFESVVDNKTGEDGESTAIPVFAVNLPQSWQIVACKALFNGTVYSCDEPDPVHSALINDNYYPGNWHSRRMPIQGLSAGDTMRVTWTIRPITPGKHKLDYWTSIYYYDDDTAKWTYEVEIDPQTDPIPFNHEITIAANVPAISGAAAFIFSALLLLTGIVYLVFRKKRSGNRTPSSLFVAFLVPAMICLLHAGVAAQADEKPTLSGADIRNFNGQVAEDPVLREALAQNPRETIQEYFDLTQEQQAVIDQLSDEDLNAVVEIFIAAEDVDHIRCMFLNVNPPRLRCLIVNQGSEAPKF